MAWHMTFVCASVTFCLEMTSTWGSSSGVRVGRDLAEVPDDVAFLPHLTLDESVNLDHHTCQVRVVMCAGVAVADAGIPPAESGKIYLHGPDDHCEAPSSRCPPRVRLVMLVQVQDLTKRDNSLRPPGRVQISPSHSE